MGKLPVVSADKIIKVLNKKGFVKVRQTGSHMALQRTDEGKTKTVIIPNHKEIAKGTLLQL